MTPGPASWGGHQEWGRRGSPRGWDRRAWCWRSSPSSPRPSPPGRRPQAVLPAVPSLSSVLLQGLPVATLWSPASPPPPAAQALVPPPTEAASPGAPAPVLPRLVPPFSLCGQQLPSPPPRQILLPASALVHQGQVPLQGQSLAPQWDGPPCGIQSHSIWAPTPSLRVHHQPEPLPPCPTPSLWRPCCPSARSRPQIRVLSFRHPEPVGHPASLRPPWGPASSCGHRGRRCAPITDQACPCPPRTPALSPCPSHVWGQQCWEQQLLLRNPSSIPDPIPSNLPKLPVPAAPLPRVACKALRGCVWLWSTPRPAQGTVWSWAAPPCGRAGVRDPTLDPILFSLLPALSPCSSDFCTC